MEVTGNFTKGVGGGSKIVHKFFKQKNSMTDLSVVQYGRGQLIAIKSNHSTDQLSNKELCFKEMFLSDKQTLPTKSEILRLLLMLTNEQSNSQCL